MLQRITFNYYLRETLENWKDHTIPLKATPSTIFKKQKIIKAKNSSFPLDNSSLTRFSSTKKQRTEVNQVITGIERNPLARLKRNTVCRPTFHLPRATNGYELTAEESNADSFLVLSFPVARNVILVRLVIRAVVYKHVQVYARNNILHARKTERK